MEALSDGHTVAPLMKVGYLHARRGAKTYLFHFGYQTKDTEYPQVSNTYFFLSVVFLFFFSLCVCLPITIACSIYIYTYDVQC